jgi:hypothetical protein
MAWCECSEVSERSPMKSARSAQTNTVLSQAKDDLP